MAEAEFYDWLRKHLPSNKNVSIGIGDDAALLSLDTNDLVVTSDLLAEGTHFLPSTPLDKVGRKALAVNLSDLAAMAARPVAAVVSLLLPQRQSLEAAKSVMEGMRELAQRFDTAIVGGDTNCWDGKLVVNVTAIGSLDGRTAMRRDKAQIGDAIFVTGTLGGSISGKHLDFEPRVPEAIRLADAGVAAAMDISDGLALDLSRMAIASGCAAALNLDAIPISAAAEALAAAEPDRSALSRALGDGEDFELLLAVPEKIFDRIQSNPGSEMVITRIGAFMKTTDVAGMGVHYIDAEGSARPLAIEGYQHRL